MQYSFQRIFECNMCGSRERRMLGMRLSASQGFRPHQAEGIAVPVKQCSACGLIYADPLPIPNDLEDHYGVPSETYWGHSSHWQLNSDYYAEEIKHAKDLLGEHINALDIGVGLGKAMVAMSRAGFDVWGIEPSKSFRDRAIEFMKLDPERIAHAPVETADFPEGKFDFVTFGAVLEHIYDPATALERALRWLKPGGIIHADVPSSGYFVAKLVNLFFRLRGTNYVTHISPMHSPFHLYEFTLKSFEKAGKRIGFEIARHELREFTVVHLPSIIHPPLRWWMKRTNGGMQLAVYLRKSFEAEQ